MFLNFLWEGNQNVIKSHSPNFNWPKANQNKEALKYGEIYQISNSPPSLTRYDHKVVG